MTTNRVLEVNGGRVERDEPGCYRLVLPPVEKGYADAQIDDYGGRKRADYPWRPGSQMALKARFSQAVGEMMGTAGFGFWNAPFGDPTVPWPALPQAAWFFYGSPPSDMPLAVGGPGRGWFASTVNARSKQALSLIPAAPLVLLLNQFRPLRARVWPPVRERLGITFRPLSHNMTEWHSYRLDWTAQGCTFLVDGKVVLQTPVSPSGPLGFVCWVDNQYLVLKVNGRFGWGTLPVVVAQWLEIQDLKVDKLDNR
jgi:hypothetical protein